jgi:hypothetical protein
MSRKKEHKTFIRIINTSINKEISIFSEKEHNTLIKTDILLHFRQGKNHSF